MEAESGCNFENDKAILMKRFGRLIGFLPLHELFKGSLPSNILNDRLEKGRTKGEGNMKGYLEISYIVFIILIRFISISKVASLY